MIIINLRENPNPNLAFVDASSIARSIPLTIPRFADAPWGWRNGWRMRLPRRISSPRRKFETKCAR